VLNLTDQLGISHQRAEKSVKCSGKFLYKGIAAIMKDGEGRGK
jgi:hypothetical protein